MLTADRSANRYIINAIINDIVRLSQHVFALLKGRESWLSPLLSRRRTSSSSSGSGQVDGEGQEQGQGAESTEPFPLPLHLSSVMSKDIKDNLEDLIDGVAQVCSIPLFSLR